MKTIRNLLFIPGFVLLVIIMLTAGCKKEDETPPELPPQSSLVMNFEDFSNPDDTLGAREIASYQNWGYSYANVVVWQTIITVGLAVPVASFVESFNHEAVYHPDEDNWTWSYNVTVNFVVYEAELTGYLEPDSVVWEMRVTKGAEYVDFLWYHGKSALDGSGGYWILQENPLNANPLLQIDWHKYDDGTADIRYTNVKAGSQDNGSYIFYGTMLSDFNRFYDIFYQSNNSLTEIEWSSVTRNGHVKAPVHFGDELWHCWDGSLMDVVCP